MNNYQEIQINVGLNYTNKDGSKGEFDRELGRFLVENKFQHCGAVSEPYQSNWKCNKTGEVYTDNCLAYKISVSKTHAFTIPAIRERVRSLCILLKQDAIAFAVNTGGENGANHHEMYYLDCDADDKLEFDPRYFHYVA